MSHPNSAVCFCYTFSLRRQIARLVKKPANLGSIILSRLEGFTPNIPSELIIDSELIMLACICFDLSADSGASNQIKNLFVLKRIDVYTSHKCFDLLGRVWSCKCISHSNPCSRVTDVQVCEC